MAKKEHIRLYCEQCKKKTTHEVINTHGTESNVCLVCQKKAIEMERAEIADQNRSIAQKVEADRNLAKEAIRNLSINSPFI